MYFSGDKERRRWPLESEQLLRIKDLPIVALPVAWETQKTRKPEFINTDGILIISFK